MEQLSIIIFPIIIFLIFFIGIWLFVCFILSRVSGWDRLASKYQNDGTFNGKRWHFRSCRMNGYVNYNGCLTFGASSAGLYMKVLPLFRFHHPPLLIPWSEIQEKKEKGTMFNYQELTFTSVPTVRLSLLESLGEKLLSASNRQKSDTEYRAYQKIEPH
ncbi:MAG: hypothetical protein ABFD50_15190 [Smithella sp.]